MGKKTESNSPALEDASTGDSLDAMGVDRAGVDGDTTPFHPDAPPNPLELARSAYETSTRYMESSLRQQWERNERAFQGRHPSGSKYMSDNYRTRSALYRPKTRHMIRQGEAHIAASYFTNEDVISIKPANATSKEKSAAADLMSQILAHRLTTANPRVAVPWFMTVVGAYQDAAKYGVVISKQWWEYVERVEMTPMMDPMTGIPMADDDGTPMMTESSTVLIDRPRVDLFPPEMVRIDPAADWRDPANSSPYLILIHPLYVMEVERRMIDGDRPWKNVARTALKAAGRDQSWDSTRRGREPDRTDAKEADSTVDEFSIVFCHENFVKWGGRDWVWWTAGTQELLSDPVPVEEEYRHARNGERPVAIGSLLIETHKTFPAGKPQLVQGLQQEINEIANLRIDNVKLAMNKRFLVRRGSQTDLRSLLRSSPGSVTMVNDTTNDVKEIDVKDVTGSSFQEQDRLNADFDDIAGIVSPGTVQTNRRMNETVGGMQLLSGAANSIGELDIRVFTETWAEPVLRQMIAMEAHYENDTTVIALAAEKARIFDRYGVDSITDVMLDSDLIVRANVGIGATDPTQKINKITAAAKIIKDVIGERALPFLDVGEFLKEVFGPLGYRDGSRFFNFGEQDPLVAMLMKELEQAREMIDKRIIDAEAKKEVARLVSIGRILSSQIETEGASRDTETKALANMWGEQSKLAAGEKKSVRDSNVAMLSNMMKQRADAERGPAAE